MTQTETSTPARQAYPAGARRILNRLLRHTVLCALALCTLAAVSYWALLASDRYVSEARVIIQRTDLAATPALDLGTLISGTGGNSRMEQMLLRDTLLSVDMLRRMDANLGLRAHYSGEAHDLFSRLAADAPLEDFYDYFRSRVQIEFDDYAGVLSIRAEAYDAATAHAVTSFLLTEGERTMNELAHQLANDQVTFAEKHVRVLATRLEAARDEVLKYQNEHGLLSPQSSAETLNTVINQLEAQRTELQARRNTLLGYLAPNAAGVVEVDLQLNALEKQLDREKARGASTQGNTLNANVEEFQRLELAAQFAQDMYRTALVALEKGRIEASRTIKKVSVLQKPTMPESPREPRRLYNIAVTLAVLLLLGGVCRLALDIIKDRKD